MANHMVALPDLPGHGKSPRAGRLLTIALLADELAQELDSRNLRDVILVGWSMGAHVAFDYLARHGTQRVAGLVVEDMTPRLINDDDWALGLRGNFDAPQNELVLSAITSDWASHSAAFLPRLFASNGQPDRMLTQWLHKEISNCDPVAMAQLWRSMSAGDYRQLLAGLDCPTLVLYGSESQLYGAEVSAWMARTLPRGHRIAIPKAGHMPHLEQPDAFNAAVRQFSLEL